MTEQNPSRRRTPKKSRAALLLAATLLVFLAAGLLVLKLRGALPGGDREAFQVPEQIVVCLDAATAIPMPAPSTETGWKRTIISALRWPCGTSWRPPDRSGSPF